MDDFFTRISYKINELEKKNQLRSLRISAPELLDFNSNDYLGLARSEILYHRINSRIESLPHFNGATGSRLLSGNSEYAEQVEEKLANLFKSESALIFNSGYSANLGVLSCLPLKGDTIFYDELAHACIKDGARLSLAKRYSFGHNDLDNLRSKLKRHAEGSAFIAVESIYSMDGDQCPLQDLVRVAKEFNAVIILDEAHSTGIVGENGNGLAASLNIEQEIPLRIYTFGKAMGIHGACIACSSSLKNYIINFSRPFIYTTALSPHGLAAIECAFDHLAANPNLQQHLSQKIRLFKEYCRIITQSGSPIQPILVPGNNAVKEASEILCTQGFNIRPILSPTVKAGSERLRICLHVFNEDESIRALALALNELYINDIVN
ncbi:MAG TPA: 8-amino-7-oxononanoate synthase [Cyclobacteriaceae bacterium]|nr:8-amino-7-oxononanoate synthase [Cyclobacteriaceae bacterium]